MQSRKSAAFFALLGELALGGPAYAHHTAVQLGNLPIEQLMQFEIEGASKHPQKLSDVPAVASIVTHEDIAAHGYRTLGDILNSIRGLYISYDRNYQYVGVRGFSIAGDYNTRVLMLVDGVRYNDSVYDQAPVGTDFNIDVDLIERVEFISGPASAVYGSNALYGVINIVTRNGSDFGGLNVATSVESDDGSQGRMTLGDSTATGGSWLVSLTRHNQPGDDIHYREFDTPGQNGGVAKDADYDRSTTFFAKYRRDDLSLTLAHGERIKGVPTASFEQAFNDNDARTSDTRTNLGMEYRGSLSATANVVARLYGGTSEYRGDYVYDDPSLYINRDESEGRWVGSEIQLSKTLARHNLVGGTEYRRDMRIDQWNFDIHPRVEYFDDRQSAVSKSLYLLDEYRPFDDLILNTGVRFDKRSNSESTVNPRLAVIYKLDDHSVAKLLHGTAFRTPNEYERSYFPALYAATSGSANGSDLERERLQSTEIILERSLTGSHRIGFSVFRNEIKDLIALAARPNGDLYFTNIAGAQTRGIELEWQSAWTRGDRLHVSYSWQHTHETESDEELANTPRHLLKFDLSGPLPMERWHYGFDVRGVSSRPTQRGSTAGYVVANLTLRMQLTPQTEISATAYNLLDQHYGDPGSPEHVMDVIEQDGRTFRLKIDHRF